MVVHLDSDTVLNFYHGMFSLISLRYWRLNALYRALKPPGYYKEWHLGIRVSSNKKFVAFISGVPLTLRVRSK